MDEITIGVIGIFVLLALFLTGLELAFGMALIGVAGYAYIVGPAQAMNMLANDFYDSLESYSLTVVPLFVLMGQIAFNAGVAKRLYDCCHKFLGHIPGGLAMATVAGATIFKAICGSIVATSATFASVAVPEMDRFNYSKKLSTGIVATVGTLGVLIPPSVTLILLGLITQVSIGKLFMAGLIPGLMISFFFALVIFGWARINPEIGPKSEKYSWPARMKTLPDVMWPVLIFLVIIGGLMNGFFTPTEAGSIGTFAVLVLCVLKGDINSRASGSRSGRHSDLLYGPLASRRSRQSWAIYRRHEHPHQVAEWVVSLPVHRHIIMIFIFLIYPSVVPSSTTSRSSSSRHRYSPAITNMDRTRSGRASCSPYRLRGFRHPPSPVRLRGEEHHQGPYGCIYKGVYPFLLALFLCVPFLSSRTDAVSAVGS